MGKIYKVSKVYADDIHIMPEKEVKSLKKYTDQELKKDGWTSGAVKLLRKRQGIKNPS